MLSLNVLQVLKALLEFALSLLLKFLSELDFKFLTHNTLKDFPFWIKATQDQLKLTLPCKNLSRLKIDQWFQ